MELQAEGRDFPGDAGRGRASMLDLYPETIVPSLCNCYEHYNKQCCITHASQLAFQIRRTTSSGTQL